MSTAGLVLETKRLYLRRFDIDDVDPMAQILGDAETMRFYKRPYTRAEAQAWIEANTRRYEKDGFGLWAMVLKSTMELAGNCGPVRRTIDGRAEIEVGWIVKRSLWRQGLATEAGRACCERAFEDPDCERVVSLIRPVNLPSRRVAEKLGMSVGWGTIHADLAHLVYVLPATANAGTGGALGG
jgi:ribosomal-protein-alanine N-acetyltransferase